MARTARAQGNFPNAFWYLTRQSLALLSSTTQVSLGRPRPIFPPQHLLAHRASSPRAWASIEGAPEVSIRSRNTPPPTAKAYRHNLRRHQRTCRHAHVRRALRRGPREHHQSRPYDWQRVHHHRHVLHHRHAFQQERETKEPVSKPRRKELFALVYLY